MSTSDNETPVLRSSVSLLDRTLWFGQIAYYGDHIQLTGWRLTGRVQKRIPIEEIQKIETWSVRKGPNFLVHVKDGRRLPCRVEKGVGLWHWKLKGDTDVEVRARS